MGLKKALRWMPRSSASPRLEEDEDNNERNGLLRSHRDQNRVVPVTDLHVDEQPKAGAHVEPKTVALKVSMHCHGCARKVEKQISKLHGVVSIRIELGMKTVTVVGNVTPMQVLETVSKWERGDSYVDYGDACNDFVNLKMMCRLYFSKVLIGGISNIDPRIARICLDRVVRMHLTSNTVPHRSVDRSGGSFSHKLEAKQGALWASGPLPCMHQKLGRDVDPNHDSK
uniref:HMA domain-containing protein n=1 Tax=Aegilops tauschii TaxID=37682 RepID=R7W8U1_AEGTA